MLPVVVLEIARGRSLGCRMGRVREGEIARDDRLVAAVC